MKVRCWETSYGYRHSYLTSQIRRHLKTIRNRSDYVLKWGAMPKCVRELPPAEADANHIHAFTRTAPQELLQHTSRPSRGRPPTPRPQDEKTGIARGAA